jgi:hypothetical protein
MKRISLEDLNKMNIRSILSTFRTLDSNGLEIVISEVSEDFDISFKDLNEFLTFCENNSEKLESLRFGLIKNINQIFEDCE